MFKYNYKGERIPDYDCDNFPVQIAIKTVKKMLRELPPVTSAEKVGKWIDKSIPDMAQFMCSRCERRSFFKTNYCPNCGKKMEVEDDG